MGGVETRNAESCENDKMRMAFEELRMYYFGCIFESLLSFYACWFVCFSRV